MRENYTVVCDVSSMPDNGWVEGEVEEGVVEAEEDKGFGEDEMDDRQSAKCDKRGFSKALKQRIYGRGTHDRRKDMLHAMTTARRRGVEGCTRGRPRVVSADARRREQV